MRRHKARWALAAVVALLALWLVFASERQPPPAESLSLPTPTKSAAADFGTYVYGARSAGQQQAELATPSQQGTAIDGQITLDAEGQLIADVGIRQLFDYFLADADRIGEDAARATMAAALVRQGLSVELVAAVLELFDRYFDYRHGQAELPVSSTALLSGRLDELRAAYEARYALRRQLLGAAVAEAFFASDETEDRFVLESQALLRDRTLSGLERQRQLNLLEQQLPTGIRAAREQSRLILTLQQRTEELRQANANDADLQRMREQLLGPAAASRLAALDQDRQRWQQRLESYRQERDRILVTAGLSAADRQAAIDALLQFEFNEHEARRVRALEALRGDGD